jgi:two-component sensor histidine kinase
VHHRVKNNLQVISSLLRLQAMEIRDPGLLAIFEESRARIHAMALVHERLYRAGTLQAPDYRAFLKDLVLGIGRAFRQRLSEVRSEVEVEAKDLDVAAAVPVGLIVNELVSNSLKHGFPAGRKGHITVRLEGSRESGYTLCVTDDGVGMPDGFAIEKAPSMGLRLVSLLTRQLQGEWDVQRDAGTKWTIRFGLDNASAVPSTESGTCQNPT